MTLHIPFSRRKIVLGNKSLLIKLFVSFFLVMIISVLIIGLTSDINFSKSLEEQIGLNKTLQLDNIVKQIDLLIEGMDKKTYSLSPIMSTAVIIIRDPCMKIKARKKSLAC
jgi:hypothetical protein